MTHKYKTILETKYFYLRPFEIDDFEHIYSLVSDPDVCKWMGGVKTQQEAHTILHNFIIHQTEYGFSYWAIFRKESNDFVGWTGLRYLSKPPHEVEIGYSLLKKFWGKGYATELATHVIMWGFANIAIKKIVAITRPDNKASQRVMEKIGMNYTKIYKKKCVNYLYYSIKKQVVRKD